MASTTVPQARTGRLEDARFLTGRGRFIADRQTSDMLQMAVLRSPVAHARINSIDVEVAKDMPGVVGIFIATDMTELGPLPCAVELKGKDGKRYIEPYRPVLARDAVKYVGEAVALVVGQTIDQARDAAEAIAVDYQDLPALADPRDAVKPDAAQIWPQAPGNLLFDWERGDHAATERAFANADHVVKLDTYNNRLIGGALETRGAIAQHDAGSGVTTLWTPSQGAHFLRDLLCDRVLKLPRENLRVVTEDVGGGFGPKFYLYAEHALAVWAARRLGRTVSWQAERGENFLAEAHARDQWTEIEMAFDRDGKILGLRVDAIANFGAYISSFAPVIPTMGMAKVISGLYAIPAIHISMRGVFTNTVPVDAYRGAGKPEAIFALERLIDMAAEAIGIDRIELRRRNLIQLQAMPYATATGVTYDSGDFPALFEHALRDADVAGFAQRRAASETRGLKRGLGLSCYLHGTGGVADENSTVEIKSDGRILVATGTQSTGQGHATTYAQGVAQLLGVKLEQIEVRQGDTATIRTGGGSGGSSSTIISVTTIHAATHKLIERAKALAAYLLEASPRDIVLRDGQVEIAGTDRRMSLTELAAKAISTAVPEELRGPLTGQAKFADQIASFPSGVIVAEAEIDPDTGAVHIDRLVSVQDVGTVINAQLVDGQMHGGIVQGLGQALIEICAYDPASGQLISGSFMDYGVPRADNTPYIRSITLSLPSPNNTLGIKGVGELGPIGAPPAIVNAIVDALKPWGISHLDMPVTPARVWQAIQQAGTNKR
ncbi:MAG: xanthine dehydrogenase family protein molybdopterin-binding subunit [Rhodospirillales bacterium]